MKDEEDSTREPRVADAQKTTTVAQQEAARANALREALQNNKFFGCPKTFLTNFLKKHFYFFLFTEVFKKCLKCF